MKLAVCDDDEVFLQKLKNDLYKTLENSSVLCEIDAYVEAESLLAVLKDKVYDGVFLDIDMPQIDGFSVAERVKKVCKNTLIIFCTNHNELVYDSFSYQPFWFLRKDNYQLVLKDVIEKMAKKVAETHQEIEFVIHDKIYPVPLEKFIYVDVSNHILSIHLCEEADINFRGRIGDIEKKIIKYNFVKINSGTIVNCMWIKHIFGTEVILKNGIVLALSRGKANLVRSQFHDYIRGRI